jgi:hypothetical protein
MERVTGMEPSVMLDSILKRKLEAYGDFMSATLLLKEAIESGNEDEVTRQIHRRDHLIRMIDGLDRQIAASTSPQEQGSASTGGMREATGELVPVLQRIMSADRECAPMVEDRLTLIRESLSMIQETGNAIHGYARNVQRIPKFLNVQG